MRCTTRTSYADRIGRVVAYIAEHLDDRLSLDRLSDVAALSPYHFHRVYRAIQGETTAQTVRRLRLHRAAGDLLASAAQPIERISVRAGYGSTEAFTRAFASAYGLPPAAYRAARGPSVPAVQPHPREIDMYTATVQPFAGVRLMALAHRGSYQKIGQAFETLSAIAGGRGLIGPGARMFGVYFDDPDSVAEGDLRALAGLVAPPSFVGDDKLQCYEIAPCVTASVIHKGPYVELPRAYNYLFTHWLASSGHEPGDQPCFEAYLNDPRGLAPTEWLTQVHLPLRGA